MLGAVGLPDLEDVVTGLFATEEGPCLEIAHETVLLLTETQETQPASVSRARTAPAAARVVAGRPMDRGLGRVVEVSYRPGQDARMRFFQIDAATQKALQTGDSSPVLAGGRVIDHLVSVDSDGAGGMIIGARLLEPETVRGQAVALALTRVVAAEGHGSTDKSDRTSVGPPEGPAAGQAGADAAGSAGKTIETLLLADSSFVYLGQPYVVAPDGRIFQPWATETGYSILVHSFAGTEEVLP